MTRRSAKARQRRRLLRRFLHRPLALAGLITLSLIALLALFAGVITGDPGANDFGAILSPPSAAHPFGTDDLGRDVLARVAFGARVSMEAGVLAAALALAIGVPLGLIAGYYRGWADLVISRVTDLMLAFPFRCATWSSRWASPGCPASSGSPAARCWACASRTTSPEPSPTARPTPGSCAATSCPTA